MQSPPTFGIIIRPWIQSVRHSVGEVKEPIDLSMRPYFSFYGCEINFIRFISEAHKTNLFISLQHERAYAVARTTSASSSAILQSHCCHLKLWSSALFHFYCPYNYAHAQFRSDDLMDISQIPKRRTAWKKHKIMDQTWVATRTTMEEVMMNDEILSWINLLFIFTKSSARSRSCDDFIGVTQNLLPIRQ